MNDNDLNRLADRVIEKMASRLAGTQPAEPADSGGPRLMNVAAAAVYMGRSTSAIQHLVKRGSLPVVKLDNKIQIDKRALDKLIAESTQ
jgi:hypothetical protein